MANQITEQRLVDNSSKAILKYTIISDGTQSANVVLMDASTLQNALNANGYIMSTNTHPKTNYRTTIKKIFGPVRANGYINLQWQNDTNSSIVVLGTGPHKIDLAGDFIGATIANPGANGTGDILISTTGLLVNDTATLFIEVKKDARDYDAGQTADPTAFNR